MNGKGHTSKTKENLVQIDSHDEEVATENNKKGCC